MHIRELKSGNVSGATSGGLGVGASRAGTPGETRRLPGAGVWRHCSPRMAERGGQAVGVLAEVRWGALGTWGSAAGCS